ncbi:MAG TPA: UDP-N-acetylmuramate dehydrogenase [Cellvibrionaceae bacterium]
MLILPQFSLERFNTLAIPASAHGYVAVSDTDELCQALAYAAEHELALLPLGGGSNIVLAVDFSGLVVHLRMRGIEQVGEDSEHVYIRAAAGENWHQLVEHCLSNHWWGLENLSLIPGSVGAAPVQNIGAYGVELEQVFAELNAINIASRLPVTFTREACEFAYRDSIFKGRLKDQYIITHVTFKLLKTPSLNLSYPALKAATDALPADELTPAMVSEQVCAIRQSKLPDPAEVPNAGSFFKNPVIGSEHFEQLQASHPDIPAYGASNGVKLAAAWLIDQAGWRGFQGDGVAVHSEQALVLTNPGHRPGSDLLQLAEAITASVFERFAVKLELEPRVY